MLNFLLRRIVYMIPTLLGVSFVVFMLIQIVPGNPVDALLPPEASQEAKENMIRDLGLDRPLLLQYMNWLGKVVQGDFGQSIIKKYSINELMGEALANSMLLALASSLFSFFFAVLLGVYAAYRPNSWVASLGNMLAICGISVPNFWGGLILMGVFGIMLGWLPPMGMTSMGGGGFLDVLAHLVLPAVAAGMVTLGTMTRMVRSNVYELLNQEFVLTLRAKGARPITILLHVMKNATPPILTVAGLQFGNLLGGSVLVETVFSWPGLGHLIYQGITQRDYPIIQAGILVISIFFVVLNIIVDALHALIDPKVQRV
ncbi:ABC transporter permease [Paenibacillus sp. IB182496]|uniref:ABC transporter permease n=1 Tax=Paenibacillus sabuli TaxID=2772509 RepID=A0A927BX02_9BACL|nr:ABC transporter permease [Paenibacillus sabuli]MBD2847039.1 ABC transporter permease [Paenibacillus sabuli]